MPNFGEWNITAKGLAVFTPEMTRVMTNGAGFTPNPDDDRPHRWPFPWPWWRLIEQLGPQPDPWRVFQQGDPHPLPWIVQDAATVILSAAANAAAQSGEQGGAAFIKEFVDDYCGNGTRPKPGPRPGPWTIAALAARLDAFASTLSDGALKDRLNEANAQLLGNLAQSFKTR